MLEQLINITDSQGIKILAAEVFLDGVTEVLNADERLPVYSVTKSVTSAAFALACDDGLVSPEMPLAQFLDGEADFPKALAQMPFERFLTMTAGKYPFRPEGDNWLKNICSLDTDYTDTDYHYSNIPAYLVGAALENAVGGELMKYLDERLFSKLGISGLTYKKSPEGHFYGATGMEISAHELALLGRLFLQNGFWYGVPIISESAVKRAVSAHVSTGSGDSYGYFFRNAGTHFSMVGKWGQRCIICPNKRLVIAYLSHEPENSDKLFAIVREFIQ